MKIPDKYILQGYFTRVNKEKTIRKGKEYQYRAIFAIWDGQKWKTQSTTTGLTTRGLADEWLDARVKELTEKGKDIMLNPETVKGFADAHYKPFLRDHKKIQYEYEFKKLDVICEFLGEKLIDEVSKLDVLAFKTWLLESPY
jgi:hypothetical protein